MADKIYIGTAKIDTWSDGRPRIKLVIFERDLEALRANMRNGAVTVVLKQRREPSAKGQTHYGEIDTWQPAQQGQGRAEPAPVTPAEPPAARGEASEDLPF